jgi:hypothetical protein
MTKRLLRTWLTVFSLMLLLPACRAHPGLADAGATSASGPLDAGSRVVLELHIEVHLPDGGVVQALLDTSAAAVLPVTRAMDVAVNLPLHNYRLRVLDEVDRALASDDVPEETHGKLRYHIAFMAPLRSGHRYTVLLDAQSGATFDDGSGAALNEQRFEFRTEGEREKDTPSKHSVKRRHHRGEGS